MQRKFIDSMHSYVIQGSKFGGSFNKNIVPVELLVKEFSDKENRLHMVITANKIASATFVLGAEATTDVAKLQPDGRETNANSEYNISDIVAKINVIQGSKFGGSFNQRD